MTVAHLLNLKKINAVVKKFVVYQYVDDKCFFCGFSGYV
mgnify:CR=1 FL=1